MQWGQAQAHRAPEVQVDDSPRAPAHEDEVGAQPVVSLRDRQQALTRDLILRSVVGQLEHGELADLTIPEVAKAAGVSVRTVYRHFATREELLAAASEWIAEHYFAVPALPETLQAHIAAAELQPASWDEHPNLVRAMALTHVGKAVRSQRRARRLKLVHQALSEVTGNLPEQEQRRAEAVFGYLSNMLAWVTMRDENGLSGEQIGKALRWALEALADDLRRRNEAASINASDASEPPDREVVMLVRAARRDELEKLQGIERAAGSIFRELGMDAIADDEPPSTATLAAFQAEGRAWVGTDEEDEPVAYLLVQVIDASAHVEQVSVHPCAARRGLGRALIETAATWARQHGLKALTLTTYRDVAWNRPYYERLGFQTVDDAHITPGLRRLRAQEVAAGLDRWPRVIMQRSLDR